MKSAFLKKFAIAILMFLIIAPSANADARLALSVPIYTTGSAPEEYKEGILGSGLGWDTLGWTLAEAAIISMTQSIVEWINSGFEGSPAFVQDPQGYFTDLADQASGAFIERLGMEGLLCSPFKLQVLYGLKINYSYSAPSMDMGRFQCTLGTAVEEWDDFMNDFVNGGWDRWLSITTNEANNPYGAYFSAVDAIEKKRAAAAERGKLEASWGGGFVSLKECDGGSYNHEDWCDKSCDQNQNPDVQDPDICFNTCMMSEGNMSEESLCQLTGGTEKNTTPGKLIADELSTAMGSSFRRLEVADEIEEAISSIVNALINQLINEGLESLSSSGDGGDGDGGWSETPPTQDERGNTVEMIGSALAYESDYKNAKQNSLDKYNWAIGIIENLRDCYQAEGMTTEINNEINPLLNDLNVKKQPYETAVNESNDLLQQAEDIKEEIRNSGTFSEMYGFLKEFESDLKPLLHDANDVSEAEDEFENSVEPYLESLINGANGMQERLNQCLSGNTTP